MSQTGLPRSSSAASVSGRSSLHSQRGRAGAKTAVRGARFLQAAAAHGHVVAVKQRRSDAAEEKVDDDRLRSSQAAAAAVPFSSSSSAVEASETADRLQFGRSSRGGRGRGARAAEPAVGRRPRAAPAGDSNHDDNDNSQQSLGSRASIPQSAASLRRRQPAWPVMTAAGAITVVRTSPPADAEESRDAASDASHTPSAATASSADAPHDSDDINAASSAASSPTAVSSVPASASSLLSSSPPPHSAVSAAASAAPPPPDALTTAFDPSDAQQALLTFLNEFNASAASDCQVSLTQLSLLRHRVMQRDPDVTALVSSYQPLPCLSPLSQQAFVAAAASVVSSLLEAEAACRAAQRTEVEVLRAIFQSELSVADTLPLTLKVAVRLAAVECCVELGFLLPPLYPALDAVIVNTFVPPPFSGLFQGDEAASLQRLLTAKAAELRGDEAGAVFSLVEEARAWMEGQIDRLRVSREREAGEQHERGCAEQLLDAIMEGVKEAEGSAGQPTVGLFGRGVVEQMMDAAIQSTARDRGIDTAQAKALLREHGWKASDAAKASSAASSSSPPPPDSNDDLRSASLSCLSCMEEFQFREGCMMRCRHFLCFACYGRYLLSHLNSGSAFILDPGHKCSEGNVSEELLFALLSCKDYARYRRFLQDSFITLQHWRWCANPRCSFVASASDPRAIVSCHCGAAYCIGCGKAGHWPLNCGDASHYYASRTIAELRQKYSLLVKLEARAEDEALLVVRTKPCPRCKTHFERDGGCNHLKCGKCGHHFCFVCLGDWATHGVSWFECPFTGREVEFKKLTFYDGVAVAEQDMETVRQMVGREVDHGLLAADIRKLREDAAMLDRLSASLPSTSPAFLLPVLSCLQLCHSALQHACILLTLYKHQLTPQRRSPAVAQLITALNQLDYFVDSIDRTVLVNDRIVGVRLVRSRYQIEDTVRVVVRRMREFACALQLWLSTEARMPRVVEDDEEEQEEAAEGQDEQAAAGSVRAAQRSGERPVLRMDAAMFFASLDRKSGQAGKPPPAAATPTAYIS